MPANIELKDGAKPNSCNARPVPYALQSAVQDEYNRLQQQGIIEKIEYSERGTPMTQSDGQTRPCGDYSVTLSLSLMVPQIPCATTRRCFSTVEWREAIYQIGSNHQCLWTNAPRPRKLIYVTTNTFRELYRYHLAQYVAVIQDDIL